MQENCRKKQRYYKKKWKNYKKKETKYKKIGKNKKLV